MRPSETQPPEPRASPLSGARRLIVRLRGWGERRVARFLNAPRGDYRLFAPADTRTLLQTLEPGDVLLVEGKTRLSSIIKYVTQSTWSHVAMYVGNAASPRQEPMFAEADLVRGVIAVPLHHYASLNIRICRAVGLTDQDRENLVSFVVAGLGDAYDTRNVIDLLRLLLPLPLRGWGSRAAFELGSGSPSRVICSTLIARAFQSIGYPILPRTERFDGPGCPREGCVGLRRRHHSRFVPRDFDLSPYFRVVKPTLERGFDHRSVRWRHDRSVA